MSLESLLLSESPLLSAASVPSVPPDRLSELLWLSAADRSASLSDPVSTPSVLRYPAGSAGSLLLLSVPPP